ncbi:BT1 family [Novymonas esmeraldas]|uniref:BT1 family n=1 Tax=Novymonas esmeraldas TaxID=1808958 RepID=A0AAW0F1W9_9TRYP
MYIWGDAIVQEVVYMLGWMPMVVLLSRLCPRGSESVVYALMAGFSNLGQTTASSIGAIIMEYGWPVFSDADPCNHENLPWLIFTCGIMVPLLVIPLNFMLIPKARIVDDIDIDGNVVRKEVGEGVVAAVHSEPDSVEERNSEHVPSSHCRAATTDVAAMK